MRHLLGLFGGDYRLALAGYHSGEGDARGALANPSGNPNTTHYVNTILSRARARGTSGGSLNTGGGTAPLQRRPGDPAEPVSDLEYYSQLAPYALVALIGFVILREL